LHLSVGLDIRGVCGNVRSTKEGSPECSADVQTGRHTGHYDHRWVKHICWGDFKGIVPPKRKILSLFTHPHVVTNFFQLWLIFQNTN